MSIQNTQVNVQVILSSLAWRQHRQSLPMWLLMMKWFCWGILWDSFHRSPLEVSCICTSGWREDLPLARRERCLWHTWLQWRVCFVSLLQIDLHHLQVCLLPPERSQDHYIPDQLLCHTHLVLMFSRVMVSLFARIEKEIGPDKIYSSFLVNATTSHASVTEQFIDCFTRLIWCVLLKMWSSWISSSLFLLL